MAPGIQLSVVPRAINHIVETVSHLTNGHSKGVVKTNGHANGIKRKLESSDESSSDEPSKKQKRPKIRLRKAAKTRISAAKSWTYSSVGGRFIFRDPIFVPEETHLIVAVPFAIEIYSTSTSLLVHRLASDVATPIAGYGLSIANRDHIFAITENGIVILWNWKTGSRIASWELNARVIDIAISSRTEGDAIRDAIFAIIKKPGEKVWSIEYIELPLTEKQDSVSITLYQSKAFLSSFKLGQGGRAIAVLSGKNLLLGCMPNRATENQEYQWLHYTYKKPLTCVDVRDVNLSKKKSKKRGHEVPNVDIVVGDVDGVLYQYDDMLQPLFNLHRSKDFLKDTQRRCKRHHWHRKAVAAVKWSKDGNYLVSGGLEETLVLWQLDTNLQQTLPHLSAAIKNISVSPRGRLYSLHLADNSIMTISTSELKPTANIVGLQTRASASQPKLNPLGNGLDSSLPGLLRTPAVLNPAAPRQILLGVPTSQSTGLNGGASASCLQGWDVLTGRQVSKQALTETNTTNFKTGPKGNILHEPTIVSLAISQDGLWLASIEEWFPPTVDKPEDKRGREVTLKFWKKADRWELVTRVDMPHGIAEDGLGALRATEIVAHPFKPEFTSIGHDGIKFWSLQDRLRNGILVKDAASGTLQNWVCSSIIPIQQVQPKGAEKVAPSTLLHAPDASVIIVALPSATKRSAISIISSATHKVTTTWTAVSPYPVLKLALLNTRLIFVTTQNIGCLNLVSGQIEFTYSFLPPVCSPELQAELTHVATLPSRSFFAVTVPVIDKPQKTDQNPPVHSETYVFSPQVGHTPVFSTRAAKASSQDKSNVRDASQTRKELIMSLLAVEETESKDGPGPAFILLNDGGEVRLLRPSGIATVTERASVVAPPTIPERLSSDENDATPLFEYTESVKEDIHERTAEDDLPIVETTRIAEIFSDTPAYSSSVQDMFFKLASTMLQKT